MKTSEQINEIAKALNKAQSIMTGAKKDSKNPFFKSNYSDLASVMQAVSLPFSENDLCFVQGAEFKDGMICVTTKIMHSSGQWVEAETMVPTVKNDPQAYGSAVTYAKRYGLQAIAGVPSVDDDAQYASAAMQERALREREKAKELKPYPSEKFEENFPKWQEMVAKGKDPRTIVSVIKTKNTLSIDMETAILDLKTGA